MSNLRVISIWSLSIYFRFCTLDSWGIESPFSELQHFGGGYFITHLRLSWLCFLFICIHEDCNFNFQLVRKESVTKLIANVQCATIQVAFLSVSENRRASQFSSNNFMFPASFIDISTQILTRSDVSWVLPYVGRYFYV